MTDEQLAAQLDQAPAVLAAIAAVMGTAQPVTVATYPGWHWTVTDEFFCLAPTHASLARLLRDGVSSPCDGHRRILAELADAPPAGDDPRPAGVAFNWRLRRDERHACGAWILLGLGRVFLLSAACEHACVDGTLYNTLAAAVARDAPGACARLATAFPDHARLVRAHAIGAVARSCHDGISRWANGILSGVLVRLEAGQSLLAWCLVTPDAATVLLVAWLFCDDTWIRGNLLRRAAAKGHAVPDMANHAALALTLNMLEGA